MTVPILGRRSALGALAALPLAARAQGGWRPARPVALVVPFAPGSGTDGVARVLAPLLAEDLGGQVVVDNRAGANGAIAAAAVARAAPDGHTLILGTNTTHAANVSLMRRLDYDPARDFALIARIGTPTFLLAVGSHVPARTAEEFLAWARANPGRLTYASANAIGVIGMATLCRLAGIEATHVPYRASPAALADIIAGRVDAIMIDYTASLGHIQGGRLRALAVTTRQRSALLPEVPSLEEAGVPGFDTAGWMAVFGPAGLPQPVVAAVGASLLRHLARAGVKERLAAIGFEADGTPAEALPGWIPAEVERWAALVRAAGIEPE
ncbi:MAG: tripartite tricarboxylate transporter substrate binding protein [Acetobacteraceae bacterium]|nr:tripartite tricarboxylate transporter substrate binding protein [Acetobacteraceae bacterium]